MLNEKQEEIISQSWNLFPPPLLTLLDSTSTPIRARGVSILSTFIPKMGAKLLKQTGLGEVFDDAIMPNLMFLPNLTPVDESVMLLGLTYKALGVLGDVLFEDEEGKGKEGVGKERMRLWDRVLRKGVFMGYAHSSEHTQIVEVLIQEMGVLVGKMGLNAVKHLKVSSSSVLVLPSGIQLGF